MNTIKFQDVVHSNDLLLQRPVQTIFFFVVLAAVSFSTVAVAQKPKPKPKQVSYKKQHLGNLVNSPYNELAPIISPDGKLLYFTMGKGNPRNLGVEKLQDCYVSVLGKDGQWGYPENLGSPINSIGNDAISGVSADGSTLFIKNFYHNRTSGLCFAKKTGKNQWQIDSITIENFINTNQLSSQCISPNGNYIIISVEAPGGYGGLDLYVCRLKDRKNNLYGPPENLGPVINTDKDDFGPFLASDGKTMYYSTYGREKFGGADVYITKRLDDSWVNWTFPQNMGGLINTPGMDAYYSIPASGDMAYFSSSIGGSNLDLFRVQLAENQRPQPVAFLSGKVVSSRSHSPLRATITCTDLVENKEVAVVESMASDGAFSLVAPIGEHYRIRAEAPGFLPFSDDLDLRKQEGFAETTIDIFLDSIGVGSSIVLQDVFFDFGSAVLQPESFYTLDQEAKLLQANPNWFLEIEGHTDSVGSEEYNQSLSEKRAASVKEYLVGKGIEANRLSIRGYGSTKPIADNETEEGRQRNRRVVFRITKIEHRRREK
jgi:outer membrane protein OmpA-like peptidoglycan-associated protein